MLPIRYKNLYEINHYCVHVDVQVILQLLSDSRAAPSKRKIIKKSLPTNSTKRGPHHLNLIWYTLLKYIEIHKRINRIKNDN